MCGRSQLLAGHPFPEASSAESAISAWSLLPTVGPNTEADLPRATFSRVARERPASNKW